MLEVYNEVYIAMPRRKCGTALSKGLTMFSTLIKLISPQFIAATKSIKPVSTAFFDNSHILSLPQVTPLHILALLPLSHP